MSMRQNLFVGIRGKTYGRVTAPRSPVRDPVLNRVRIRSPGHLVGMIARPDEWSAGDLLEAQRAGEPAQFVEFRGR